MISMGSQALVLDLLKEIIDDILDAGDHVNCEHSWLLEVQVHPQVIVPLSTMGY